MAVPKSKQSKKRSAQRFASNYKAKNPTTVECPHCHEQKLAHRVCPHCGYYNKVEVVAKAEPANN